MSLPGALTLTTLSGTYTAPDGTPLGGQLTFTPSSALTNESGHPVLAATPLTVRLAPGTGSFSISLLNTDNALLPDTWMWHVIVAVPGAQESYFFGLPSTLGDATDINTLTPVSPPPSGASFVSSVNGQTGDVILADGFGILPPAGDLGGGTTLAPQVTATHLAAPLPIAQGGTGAASGGAALTALGGISAASPAFTGTPTAPTAAALTASTQVATTAYADSAVAVEASRAATAEALKLAKASNLSDLASASTARTNLGLGTAAVLASSAVAQTANNLSDLANAATARGNLGAQGVRTPTAVKTGTSYTASAGDFARIDSTAGAYTVTLPAAPADKTVVGVKLVASSATVNAVTITRGGSDTFNVSGGTTLTLKLLNQGVLLQYDTAATAWDVHSDDLPLGGLDTRYANVFSPMAYGAAGNGTTDDTTAVLAAFGAAATAHGTVDLGTRTFKTSSAIPLASFTRITGSAQGAGAGLTNSTSDLFSVTGTIQQWSFENCTLTASAGHVFNCASASFTAFGVFRNVEMIETSATHAIWYMPNGTYINMLLDHQCLLSCSGSATQAPWYVVGQANSNIWASLRASFSGASATVPFFWLEFDASSSFSSGNTFRDVVAEQCVAGIINALSVSVLTIDNVLGYDVTTYNSSLFSVGPGTGGLRSQFVTVRNSGRVGGALGSGAFDFQADAASAAIILENVGPESGPGTYSTPAKQTTINNGLSPSQLTVPAVQVAGIAPSPSPARLLGGSTVAGPPASGTWTKLDIHIDSADVIWVCTAGGTPGTWTQASAPPVTSPTTTATLANSSAAAFASTSAGAFTITLGSAVTCGGGASQTVVKASSDANALSVAAPGGQTIGGTTTAYKLTAQGDRLQVMSDGSNWQVTEYRGQGVTLVTATNSAWPIPDGANWLEITAAGGGGQGGGAGAIGASTLTTALTSGVAVTSLAFTALPIAITSGQSVTVVSGANSQTFVTTATAAIGATSVAVTSLSANFSYPVGSSAYGNSWQQAGPGGGAAGCVSTQVVAVGSNTTLNITIGAGGSAAGGGAAAGSNPGIAGSAGTATTVTGTGISVRGAPGPGGNPSTASSSIGGGGGVFGTTQSVAALYGAGCGGWQSAGGGPNGLAAGGGGSGQPATYATGAGSAGVSGTAIAGGAVGGGGQGSGNWNGQNATAAAANSAAGGGGGGAGYSGGTGGNGAAGGSGWVLVRVVG